MISPWRSHGITWSESERRQLLDDIYNFKVKGGIQYLNCFLLGQSASGKTSFFNTCATALKDEGRILRPLTVLRAAGSSVTTKFETHPLYTKSDQVLKLRIFDCRGLHDIKGVTDENIRLILDGHVKHGYEIAPDETIHHTDDHYRVDPQLGDKMHCVVYVVNAENPGAALAGNAATKIFEKIRRKVSQTHVPQIVLMNKVDRLRASLANDISELFRSEEVKKKFAAVANFMNLPDMNILPMSNYHSEPVPNRNKDILALTNLKIIMGSANDFVQGHGTSNAPSGFFD